MTWLSQTLTGIAFLAFIDVAQAMALCISCRTEGHDEIFVDDWTNDTLLQNLNRTFHLPTSAKNCRESTSYRATSKPNFQGTQQTNCHSNRCVKIKGSYTGYYLERGVFIFGIKPENEEFVIRGCWEEIWPQTNSNLNLNSNSAQSAFATEAVLLAKLTNSVEECVPLDDVLPQFHTHICLCTGDLCNSALKMHMINNEWNASIGFLMISVVLCIYCIKI